MSSNTVKIMISTFGLIVSLFFNTVHGMEENEKDQLGKTLKLCPVHSNRLAPSFFGSFDEPEARRKLCYACNIDNIRKDAGNEIHDAYFKYMKQLFEQGHISLCDLIDTEIEILEHKNPITHFQK